MNEPQVTVIGNVAQDVRHVVTDQGVPITSFRLASTRRHYDRALGRWVDGETTFLNVTCWRSLADHVRASVSKGDPVVVIGRLRVRPWEREGYKGNAVEIDAYSVGHDLNRGTSAFRRVLPRSNVPVADRDAADALLMKMETHAQPGSQQPGSQQPGSQQPVVAESPRETDPGTAASSPSGTQTWERDEAA